MADEKGYSSRPWWFWVLIYVVVGGLVYYLVYYFWIAKRGGYNYQNPSQYNYQTK